MRGRIPASADLYQHLNGLTAAQVHEKAERIRWELAHNRTSLPAPEETENFEGADPPNNAQPPARPKPPAVAAAPAPDPAPTPPVGDPVHPPDPSQVPDPTWTAKPNARGTIYDKDGGNPYIVTDLFAWEKLLQATSTGNESWLADLVKRGMVTNAENGTSVLILARHDDVLMAKGVPVAQVQMLDGKMAGRKFFVSVTSLAVLVDPDVAKAHVAAKAEEERRMAQAAWQDKVARVYPVAKKALIDAKNRGFRAPAERREAAIKGEKELAAKQMMKAFELTRQELDKLMIDGKAMEDAMKRRTPPPGPGSK